MSLGNLSFKLDWLSVSVPVYDDEVLYPIRKINAFLSAFRLQNVTQQQLVEANQGRNFYDRSLFVGYGVQLLFCRSYDKPEKQRQGIMLDFTGQCCTEYCRNLLLVGSSIEEVLKDVFDCVSGVRITRIDLALDIKEAKTKEVTPRGLKIRLDKRNVKMSSKKYNWIEAHDLGYDDTTGETLYVGRRGSVALLRVYDKAKERKYHHGDSWLPSNLFWVRWEWELRGEYATNLIKGVLENSEEVENALQVAFANVTLMKFRPLATASQVNSKRYKTAEIATEGYSGSVVKDIVPLWYVELIQGLEGKRVKVAYTKNQTLVGMANWLSRSVASALVKALAIHQKQGGDAYAFLSHILMEGKSKYLSDDKKKEAVRKVLDNYDNFHEKPPEQNYLITELLKELDIELNETLYPLEIDGTDEV